MSEKQKMIGSNLQAARKNAGFKSAAAFAEHVNISKDTYTGYEQGRIALSYERAWEFADVFGCTLDEVGGRTPPAREYADPRQGRLNDIYAQLDDDGRAVVCEIAEFQVCKDEAGVSEEAAGDKRRKTG